MAQFEKQNQVRYNEASEFGAFATIFLAKKRNVC